MIRPPAKNPCGSCPYRRDVPSGVWAPEEYAKLPDYDGETAYQPPSVFLCHQQDGCLCAGWTATHDMANNLGMRMAVITNSVTPEDHETITDYTTDVPLFASGAEAAEHGLADVEDPGDSACKTIVKLERRRGRLA